MLLQTSLISRAERSIRTEVAQILFEFGQVYSAMFPEEGDDAFRTQYWLPMQQAEAVASPIQEWFQSVDKHRADQNQDDVIRRLAKAIAETCVQALRLHDSGDPDSAWLLVIDAMGTVSAAVGRGPMTIDEARTTSFAHANAESLIRSEVIREIQSAAAKASHREDELDKKEVFRWLDVNYESLALQGFSRNAIAGQIVQINLVNLTFDTVRRHITKWLDERKTSAG